MEDYIQRFREIKNRCYSTRISEKEAVEFASLGLLKLPSQEGVASKINKSRFKNIS
jgi:hypothetical protein